MAKKQNGKEPVPEPDWTVMIYMAASKEDQGITEAAAVRDLRELEQVGTSPQVSVVVQIDRLWPGTAERYRIHRNRAELLKPTGYTGTKSLGITSSGDRLVLERFLKETRDSDPAKNYLLVLWGHSFGLGFGRDHGDALSIAELRRALKNFAADNKKLDLLGANACAMSYAEAAFELQDGASYLVASEITMPFAGWPYANILEQLSGKDPEQAGLMIVEEFLKSYRGKTVALSLLDLQHAKDLSALKPLSDAVKVALSKSEYRERIAHAFQDTAHGDVRPLIDLKDLCDRLKEVGDEAVKSAATALSDSLKPKYKDKASAEANAKAKAKDRAKDKLVVFHQADTDFEGLNGVGIYAPVITSAPDLARLELDRKEYTNLALLREASNWTPLVYDDLRDPLDVANAAVIEFVARTGAGTLEQRGGVSQLLVGVWRSFDKVDYALRGVETEVKALLDPSASSPASSQEKRLEPTPGSFLRLLPPPAEVPQSAMNRGRTTGKAVKARAPFLRKDQKPHIQEAFKLLEDAVAGAEKTISRALTNGTLGLGAIGVGNAGEGPVKGSLGVGERSVKFGFGPPGEGGVKGGQGPGGEGPVKGGQGPGGEGPVKGLLGPLNDGGLTMLNSVAAEVVDLFRAVAISLRSLEQAVANLEEFVFGEAPSAFSDQAEAEFRAKDQIRRALRAVRDELTSASETSMLVLQHPVHGMGPAPGGLGAFGRKHLATRGGLTSGFLRLM